MNRKALFSLFVVLIALTVVSFCEKKDLDLPDAIITLHLSKWGVMTAKSITISTNFSFPLT